MTSQLPKVNILHLCDSTSYNGYSVPNIKTTTKYGYYDVGGGYSTIQFKVSNQIFGAQGEVGSTTPVSNAHLSYLAEEKIFTLGVKPSPIIDGSSDVVRWLLIQNHDTKPINITYPTLYFKSKKVGNFVATAFSLFNPESGLVTYHGVTEEGQILGPETIQLLKGYYIIGFGTESVGLNFKYSNHEYGYDMYNKGLVIDPDNQYEKFGEIKSIERESKTIGSQKDKNKADEIVRQVIANNDALLDSL
ncbi:MAG: hypothetical protein ACRCXZ_07800 [Patescibacteria group bacterium]